MTHYDTVIIGGAVMGSSTAYWLSENPDYDGTVLVVEPDPTYERTSTTRSEGSIRFQFSNPVNIGLSMFGMEFLTNFHENVEVRGESPDVCFRGTGYLFLATEAGMDVIRANHRVQRQCGAEVEILSTGELENVFPWIDTDGLAGASLGSEREGTLDPWSLMQGFRARARHNGIEYRTDRVVDFSIVDGRVVSVHLESGDRIGCGHVVNCAGPRASEIASMAGLELPVEPRIRTAFAFDCRTPIDGRVPLTIDTSGVHFRRDPPHYLAGGVPRIDQAVDPDDLDTRTEEWEEVVWPAIAHRVPQWDRVSLVSSWCGHYSYNVLDTNAVVGPSSSVDNFIFANGFSGHGLQQSAGVGRGVMELITYGEYRSLDLTDLGYERVVTNEPFLESAII